MRTLGALVVGAVSGAAGTLLHQHWWGLALALAAGLVSVAWLPAGSVRLAFALGWCVPVARGAIALPSGGFLVAADAAGWSFLAGSGVLLVTAVLTVASGPRPRREGEAGRAGDHGSLGPAS